MRQQFCHRAHALIDPPGVGKALRANQMVPTHIGVRSANRSASIRISGAPVFRPSSRASSRLASSSEAPINRPSGSRPPAPTISENRVRDTQRIGEPWRLHIGAAAAFGAHQAALGQCRQRPAHGVAIDPIGLGDFGLARQPFARGKAAIGDAALDPVGDLPPQCHAGGGVLHAHGVERPGKAIGKIILLSRNSHGVSLSSCLIS